MGVNKIYKNILVVFGTRPEAIKMAPVVKLLKKQETFNVKVCVTGQHKEMLYQVLKIFNLNPDFDLEIMTHNQNLSDITSRVILKLSKVLIDYKPELVIVHGDTTTSLSAALSAFYQKIDVAHVEAGLRTNDIYSPWPEELNRQIISRIAKYHFAPTKLNKQNLLDENINSKEIFVTGNTGIDALLDAIKINESTEAALKLKIKECGYDVEEKSNSNRRMILVTGHRRENFGLGFSEIAEALYLIARQYSDVDIVYPMHLNSKVRDPLKKVFEGSDLNNIFLIEPLEYLPFVYLMKVSYLILTDSGGIQEEAPSIGKPVLVMRDNTERMEAVNAGTVKLVGANKENIYREVVRLLHDQKYYKEVSSAINPYGNSDAAHKIVGHLSGKK